MMGGRAARAASDNINNTTVKWLMQIIATADYKNAIGKAIRQPAPKALRNYNSAQPMQPPPPLPLVN